MTKKDLIICLYGSTGDLAFRKLLPAISNLKYNNKLPSKTKILVLGRRDFNTKDYFDFINSNNGGNNFSNLVEITEYINMQISDLNDFGPLSEAITNYSNKETLVIHYLAISSNLMLDVAKNISDAKLVIKNNLNHRIVFEKPFGNDFISSSKINNQLLNMFDESQIFRIDHYLGKDLIKAILDLRFKTNLLESALSPEKLLSIDIVAKEEDGILNRGAFYDETGAIKDMFQSHLLQIVSLLTMNKPKKFTSDVIANEKVKALKKTKIKEDSIVFGQYYSYLEEENVSSNSLTETLIKLTLNIKNKFKNVDINIFTGKKLDKKETYIKFNLKDGSEINLNIFPNKSIVLKTKLLNEVIDTGYNFKNIDDEYATLINAVINNYRENFVRSDEIEIAWKISDELLSYKDGLTIYNEKTFK